MSEAGPPLPSSRVESPRSGGAWSEGEADLHGLTPGTCLPDGVGRGVMLMLTSVHMHVAKFIQG